MTWSPEPQLLKHKKVKKLELQEKKLRVMYSTHYRPMKFHK